MAKSYGIILIIMISFLCCIQDIAIARDAIQDIQVVKSRVITMNTIPQRDKIYGLVSHNKQRYLVLEISVTVSEEKLLIFAHDFLLISSAAGGSKYCVEGKSIERERELIQPSAYRPFVDRGDHVSLDKGRTTFWVGFCLPFDIEPTYLSFLGFWPVVHKVPFQTSR